ALIRWLGSNVFYLSFFSNFVLLGSFLGIGAGFLRSGSRRDLSGWAPVLLGMLVVLARGARVTVQRSSEQLIFFGAGSATSGVLAVETFTPRFSWSPYYKVTQLRTSPTTVQILVNGIPHQTLGDVHHDPWLVSGFRQWPYQDAGPGNPLDDVLVVGAGSGNDV